jgi:signal transduction histidine kinase
MRHREEAEHRRRWDALAAGLAHEIKNPLSTMSISLQLMREDVQSRPNVSSAQITPRIDLLIGEVDRLKRILDDFLRLARSPELDLQKRDPNDLIENMLAFVSPELGKRSITLVTDLDRGIGEVVLDPNLFRQALLNLVRNAMEAMEGGGTLSLLTRGGDAAFTIDVIDTGRGIGDEIRDRIFASFFSTKQGGTGIGLPLTRQLIELHDGTVDFESAPGFGTRFRVRFPNSGPRGGPRGE